MDCHEAEAAAWAGSHHDLAMQVATDTTVLGDFSDVTFTYRGRPTWFFRRGGEYRVRTAGPAGEPAEYRVAFTFGVSPLQQYVIEFPEGKYQVLGVAWDARSASVGGQRWYHLYPEEDIAPGDPLHWTGLEQRWNYQCAACHSTGVRKNHDPATDRYETTWSDLDVGCEACHGPGSVHVEWAQRPPAGAAEDAYAAGLAVDLADRDDGIWGWRPGERIASRSPERTARSEIAACAACHSRRQLIDEAPEPGAAVLDRIRPALLTEGLYHSDGQILEEVFVYGSFLQSAMYGSGVTCGDCHDPHSLRVLTPGNGLCGRCHLPEAYDTPAHHFHSAAGSGGQCVECHMTARVYMGVDSRRDHSLRVPRPDLSASLGTPNACTECHTDRSAAWAADAARLWYGPERAPHFGEALARGRAEAAEAGPVLAALARDRTQPGMVRATALERLGEHIPPPAMEAIREGLSDPDPLVRFGATLAAEAVPPDLRAALLRPLLLDSVKLVRTEAARVLALTPVSGPAPPALLDTVIEEYVTAQLVQSDRAEAHVNISTIRAARGRLADAESSLRTALRLDSAFAPAWVNLADLLRVQDRDREAEPVLRRAVAFLGQDAAVRHALGLLLVRQGRLEEGLAELAAAATAEPGSARFAYVYGVALHAAGEVEAAIDLLTEARARHPGDIEILTALVFYSRDLGRLDEALELGREWVALEPGNPSAVRELTRLERLRDGGGRPF